MHIGKRMKEIRRLRKMTQAKVSDGIISSSHYSNIEGGRYMPPSETISLLAERLAVPSSYLLGGMIDDKELALLLKRYEELIETDELEQASQFFKTNKKKFEYIPSLQQEFYFNLLRCLHLFKTGQDDAFSHQYSETIVSFMDQESTSAISSFLQRRYFYIVALYHYIHNEYLDSIHYQRRALQLTVDPILSAKLNFNIALCYFHLSRYAESIEFTQKSKDFHLNLHNWRKVAECYNLLAVIYLELKDIQPAKEYINKGLQILDDESEVTYPILLHNYALIYKEEQQYEKALTLINDALRLKKGHKLESIFFTLQAKIEILFKMNETLLAKNVLSEAEAFVSSDLNKVQLEILQCKLHLQQNEFKEYEKKMQSSINYFQEHKNWKRIKELTEEFAEYYEDSNKYKQANINNRLCIQSINNMYKELMRG